MKFKQYGNEYEKVFSDEKRVEGRCSLDFVAPFNNNPPNTTLYIKQIRETIRKMELDAFDSFVKFEWLKRRFCFRGRRIMEVSPSYLYKAAYGNFMRYHVGYNNRFYFLNQNPFNEILKYIDDFFPNFEIGDPFKEKYEYPYSYIGLDCLGVVSKMPEKLDLLKHADFKEMKYAEFLDYVINYILCYNDEHGEKYRLILSNRFYPYVKILKNEEKTSSICPRSGRVLSRKFVHPKCLTSRNVGGSNKPQRTS